MDAQLRILVELQKLDSAMLALKLGLDILPAQATSASAALRDARKAFETADQQQLSLEKKKRDLERKIEDLLDKIAKMKGRSADIKTNKEFQAHLKEIETNESEIRAVEDQILVIMESLDTVAQATAAAKQRLESEKGTEEAGRKDRDALMQRSEEELRELKDQRKLLAATVEPDLYNLYMELLKVCRGRPVVEVSKEVCQGCNLNIPPQLFVQIKAGGTIFQCPQCRRILYYIRPQADDQTPAQTG
jgi:predicted  nucleic acid-binding Zn-ribbon protein